MGKKQDKREQSNDKGGRKLKDCGCVSPYQDRKYGKGKRICNRTTKDSVRCTVCGREIK